MRGASVPRVPTHASPKLGARGALTRSAVACPKEALPKKSASVNLGSATFGTHDGENGRNNGTMVAVTAAVLRISSDLRRGPLVHISTEKMDRR